MTAFLFVETGKNRYWIMTKVKKRIGNLALRWDLFYIIMRT